MEFKIIENIEKHQNLDEAYLYSLHVCKSIKDDKMKTYCHPICKNKCYEKQKKYFEQYCSYVRNPEAICVERLSDSSITYTKMPSMRTRFESNKEFINVWLNDVNKLTYQRCDFIPYNKNKTVVPEDVYNIFHSFEIQRKHKKVDNEKRKKLIEPIIKHFNDLFDKEVAEYLIKYFAFIIQYPERKGENSVAIVIQGEQGDGKTFTIENFIIKLIGNSLYTYTCKPDDIFNNHSEAMTNKLVVNLDEVKGKSTFDMSDILKSFTTQTKLIVNPKGIRPYQVNNYCIYIFTTNNETPLKIELGDRRYFATRTKQSHRNDKTYYSKMDKYTDDIEVLSAWYDYLMSLNVEKVDFTATRPKTKYYNQLVESSLPHPVKYVEYLVSDFAKTNDIKKLYKVSSELMFEGYKTWKEKTNIKDEQTLYSLAKSIKRVEGIETKHKRDGNYYFIDCEKVIKYFKKNNLFDYGKNNNNQEEEDESDDDTLESIEEKVKYYTKKLKAKQLKVLEEYEKILTKEKKPIRKNLWNTYQN
jgi:hypothetical protein